MSFQLVYLPKSGNTNYWTVNNYFTHKDNQHFYWDQSEQLCDEFSRLKKKFPTLFDLPTSVMTASISIPTMARR